MRSPPNPYMDDIVQHTELDVPLGGHVLVLRLSKHWCVGDVVSLIHLFQRVRQVLRSNILGCSARMEFDRGSFYLRSYKV